MKVTVMEIISDLKSIEQEEGTSNGKLQRGNIGGPLKESCDWMTRIGKIRRANFNKGKYVKGLDDLLPR